MDGCGKWIGVWGAGGVGGDRVDVHEVVWVVH